MSELDSPRINKAPFILGDLLLVGVAAWIILSGDYPPGGWAMAVCAASVGLGAWLSIRPFVLEYQTDVRRMEGDDLKSAVDEIENLKDIAAQIKFATGQWQAIQDQSTHSVKAAEEIGSRMTEETQRFTEFMKQADSSEKGHLRLEVDKLRRGEQEWVKTVVQILDHIYSIQKAATKSADPKVLQQLTNLQNACCDITRRVGLIPHTVQVNEPYNEKLHQLIDKDAPPADRATVGDALAPGFTFQGRLLRKPLVKLQSVSADSIDQSGDSPPDSEGTENPSSADEAREPELF